MLGVCQIKRSHKHKGMAYKVAFQSDFSSYQHLSVKEV
jgi:hypothetical protein